MINRLQKGQINFCPFYSAIMTGQNILSYIRAFSNRHNKNGITVKTSVNFPDILCFYNWYIKIIHFKYS